MTTKSPTFLFFSSLLGSFIFLLTATGQNTNPVTLQTALTELLDAATLPAYLDNTICAQVSSYDPTGGNDDGFSGRYSYLRRNPDSTLVIFDAQGPGVINRIWTPTPSDDSLDFYLDDLTRPAFTICYRDLFSGKVFPFSYPLCGNQLGGFYSYLPIPFRENCRIVFKGKKTQFHQIQYRQYPAGTPVKTFGMTLSPEENSALQKVKSAWTQTTWSTADLYPGQATLKTERNVQIRPGETHTLFKLKKGGRILGLEFEPASAFEGLAKQFDIRITWDQEKTPAVFCPVADFFGYAFGKASMKSRLAGVQGDRAYSYFPMPFDQSATVELIYRKPDDGGVKASPVAIQSRITYTLQARDPGKEGKFYTWWNRNNPAVPHQPHLLLAAAGKGHYVGTVLQAQGLKSGMTIFFEGDDSTAVDGQFRMHGTGSEDYFNGGWYALSDRWDAAMSLPLSGALDYSLPFCRTGGFRLFLGDKISFEKSFHHDIEHGPTHNSAPADYTSVAYFYCDRPPSPAQAPANSTTGVFLPDTLMLYPQLLNLGIAGEIAIKPRWAYPTGGETYFCTVAENAGLRIPLEGVPAGDYRLYLDYIKDPAGCSFSVWQRQTQVSDWFDTRHPAREREGNRELCVIRIDPLVKTITFRFKTGEGSDQFIFNRLILIRE